MRRRRLLVFGVIYMGPLWFQNVSEFGGCGVPGSSSWRECLEGSFFAEDIHESCWVPGTQAATWSLNHTVLSQLWVRVLKPLAQTP